MRNRIIRTNVTNVTMLSENAIILPNGRYIIDENGEKDIFISNDSDYDIMKINDNYSLIDISNNQGWGRKSRRLN